MNSIEKLIDRMMQDTKTPVGVEGVAGSAGSPAVVLANAPTYRSKPGVAELDLTRLAAAGMITPQQTRSQIAEEYRAIKRPLLKNAFGAPNAAAAYPNLIMVTSAIPGEGKSFTSVNLAMSIAMELDHTVLLVEADVAKPAMARYLGLPADVPGLVDFLADERISLEDLLLGTNVPKLSLLRSGRSHPNATELLASQNMSRLFSELSQRYPDRVVIIDAPPMLVSSEAVVLASLVGQVVMVVEYGKTPQQLVKDALKLIGCDKAVGIILNKSHSGASQSYGYGSYGAPHGGRE